MGLHYLSKSFKPNLATTRVFSLGTKFIPVWKTMKIVKPFSKFQDFHRRMANKVFFEETMPGTFVKNKNTSRHIHEHIMCVCLKAITSTGAKIVLEKLHFIIVSVHRYFYKFF